MPGARDTRAGGAYVELSLRNQAFIRGLRGSLGQLKAFGASIQSIGAGIGAAGMRMMRYGAGIVAPLLLSARAFGTVGHELTLMSARTGMGVEALSELGYAAELSGAKLEDVEIGIKKMQKAISAGKAGGFDLSGLQGLDPDTQLKAIGDLLTGISDPADRAAAAIALFGRSGTKLLPMLSNMEALRAEARRLGLVMSKEDAQAADTFMDSMERLWAGLKRVSVIVGSALAPMLTDLAGDLLDIAVTAGKWFKENKGLVISLLKIGAAVLGAGVLLSSLGGIISAVGTAFVAFSVVGTSALSFLLSPIGMTIAAITGIGATILWATGAGGDALKWLGERFAALKGFAVATFQGIKDALSVGDFALAAKILWLGLKAEWMEGMGAIKKLWIDFRVSVTKLISDVFWGWAVIAEQAAAWAANAWIAAAVTAKDAFDVLRAGRDDLFTWLGGRFEKTFAIVLALDEEQAIQSAEDIDKRVKGEISTTHEILSENILTRSANEKVDTSKANAKRDANIAKLSEGWNAETDAIGSNGLTDKAKVDADIKAAKEKLALAVKLAEAKKYNAQAMDLFDGLFSRGSKAILSAAGLDSKFTLPNIPKFTLPNIPKIEQQLRDQMDVSGQFGSEASDRMGYGSTIAERTAKAAETTAKNTKTISDKLDDAEGILVD